jgi:NADPH:quinone reductase-like Zn-dependent oxidoreductase
MQLIASHWEPCVLAINYNDEALVEIVREAGGANLILDIIGGDYVARNIKAASTDARIVRWPSTRAPRWN